MVLLVPLALALGLVAYFRVADPAGQPAPVPDGARRAVALYLDALARDDPAAACAHLSRRGVAQLRRLAVGEHVAHARRWRCLRLAQGELWGSRAKTLRSAPLVSARDAGNDVLLRFGRANGAVRLQLSRGRWLVEDVRFDRVRD